MNITIPEALKKSIMNYKRTQNIHLVQDWIDDTLYYGFNIEGVSYLVNSKIEFLTLDELTNKDYKPFPERMGKSLFPIEYLNDSFEERLNKIEPEGLISRLTTYLRTYIYLEKSNQYEILALWIIGTFFFRMFRYYPYVHLQGEKGSGKSTLLDVVLPIVFNGQNTSSLTAASLFRSVDEDLPTLCIDEFDTASKQKSESEHTLIKILKDGFKKGGKAIRSMGKDFIPIEYSTYCPKIFAGIKEIENVLADRMIRISMIRKTNDSLFRYYRDTTEIKKIQLEIKNDIYLFALKYTERIYRNYLEFENTIDNKRHLTNRAGEMWSPLYSIAEIIDEMSGTYIYSEIVADYSKYDIIEKEEFNEVDNELVQFLNIFLEAIDIGIEELNPIHNDPYFITFNTEDVYKYFQKEKIIPNWESKTKLTQTLKRTLGITVKPYYDDYKFKTSKLYVINRNKLNEYKSRYLSS